MGELRDYSGPLKPDLRFEDFSKEALIDLLYAYAKMYLMMYNQFITMIEQRHGPEEAWASQVEAWIAISGVAMRVICDTMKIEPGSIEGLLKALQLDPAFPANFDKIHAGTARAELKDKNHGVVTLSRCGWLELFEMGGRDMVVRVCHGMEPPTFTAHARWHNPNIMCRAVKLPPRESPDESPVCIWEYRLEEEGSQG